ncbi:methionyl-tRNA formyltransferase [Corynebacterium terpenotabidum]|uniref:Methionyl-tRNA formyltransferase n=1 Tax=Corynebacterium terpenotabidum Y-11 TaxID=1200352 RepID=S4XGP3_9CORY|nr:methionyl-tRNA formyltransferase [Corynebacterium terpenotabidum]AGP30825.1 methionyl-tRNA formyltransferase [Corynebacterium terpenotabidum Y-11]
MRILFAGTPEPAAVTLRYLLEESDHEVVAVLTQPDAKRGRGRTLHPSAVAEVAEAAGVPVHKWPSLKASADGAAEVREVLRGYADDGVDAVAVVAYGQILPADVLDMFRHGWINLHFSLLPRWRGAAPVQAAIAAGDAVTGASTFRIVPELDAGPVTGTVDEAIGVTDTADDLLTRLTYAGRVLLSDTLTGLASGQVVPAEQSVDGMTYAAKITSADARVDWTRPAVDIQRVTRAHTPAPGPWTTLAGERYKLGLLMPVEDDAPVDVPAGELVVEKNRVLVGTGDDVLQLTRIQPPGKKMMDAADWVRGRADLFAGTVSFDADTADTADTEGEN